MMPMATLFYPKILMYTTQINTSMTVVFITDDMQLMLCDVTLMKVQIMCMKTG